MRYVVATVMVVTFPVLASAQSAPVPPPSPSIGLPLPSIGLPLPPIGLDAPLSQSPRVDPTQPSEPGGRPHRPAPAFIFFGAPYGFGVDPALQSKTPGVIAPTPPELTPAPPPPTGILKLDVEPAQLAQVFVDGEYVGTPADLDNQLELTPGTHRIEIRARGYETLTFDARVVAGRTITYRETLSRVDLTPLPGGDKGKSGGTGVAAGAAVMPDPNPTSRKTTFYFIPGCYLGNVPPTEVKLPANCDFSRMITHTP